MLLLLTEQACDVNPRAVSPPPNPLRRFQCPLGAASGRDYLHLLKLSPSPPKPAPTDTGNCNSHSLAAATRWLRCPTWHLNGFPRLRFVPPHLLQQQPQRRAATPVLTAAFALPAANWLTSACRTTAATSDMARPAIHYLTTRLLP